MYKTEHFRNETQSTGFEGKTFKIHVMYKTFKEHFLNKTQSTGFEGKSQIS